VTAWPIGVQAALDGGAAECRTVIHDGAVELRSPAFVFRLDTTDGLKAGWWENRLSGTRIALGGPELEVEVGAPGERTQGVRWVAGATRVRSERPGEAVIELASESPRLSATVRYVWDADRPVLRKLTEIRNDGDREINRLLNVRLGHYTPDAAASPAVSESRGFPAYVGDEFFLSLAHPAGFAIWEDGRVVLRQYPGIRLAPGQTLQCMEAVYGVAKGGEARNSFVRYVRSRMRRVARGHDKPYAILESFGGQPSGDFWVTEAFLLEHLARVAQGLREGAPAFDFYCTEFWHDPAGDLTTFHPKCFPNGYSKVRDEILKLGMRPGLWIDSGGLPTWSIGQNPAIRNCFTKGPGQGEICRASEPINSMYIKAFIHHVRENKVGLLKFDNVGPGCGPPCCINTAHEHLPGPLYSVEAIHNALIRFYRELDAACPDVFIMLYWGYRSPWWLEYGDTYFESGAHIEAASPTESPAPYARDSVTHRLDQAQSRILDTPWLGKDSLGVWLSDWAWNSGIGNGRWQEGFIMDLCRGSLLAQIWTDTNWLTPAERRQLAEFIALFRSNARCFDNSRFILGDPLKSGPYGYGCGDGKRAFLAVHNACLRDSVVSLTLGPACGLPDSDRWDIYQWHPRAARLDNQGRPFGRQVQMALRPHEVVLLEVVTSSEEPSLKRVFDVLPMRTSFAEPTRQIELGIAWATTQPEDSTHWRPLRPTSASASKASLAIRGDDSILAGGETADGDVYTVAAATDEPNVAAILVEALTDDSLPSRGPGRAENGNFALTEVRVVAAPKDKPGEAVQVSLRAARADFSQTSHGGWPVAAAIDANPSSGWSIHPKVGVAHAAIFELATPVHLPGGMLLILELRQGERAHSLGRLRLSVSSELSPRLPAAYAPGMLVAKGELPASGSGGLLLLTGDRDMETPKVTLAGREIVLESVWPEKAYWASPWKAWRAEVEPAETVRQLQATVATPRPAVLPRFEVHFLPK
jgi:hypothetical protein